MPQKKSTIPEETIKLYEKLVKSVPGIELKGATMPYTSHNGNMFSFLDKEGNLSLRLSEEMREEFIKKFKTKLSEQHGSVLKEYVSVPDKVFKDVATIKKYFRESVKYANSLKPKKGK